MTALCTTPLVINTDIPAHNIFKFDNGVTFSSNFDNGNLARVERLPNRPFEFKIWTAPDNMGTEHQSRHCAWYHFIVSGAPMGCVLRIQIVNASCHSGLYKHDMRPVYKSNSTNQKFVRIKSSVRFIKEGDAAQLFFEHGVDAENDKITFAFTYPYSYTQIQSELDALSSHQNNFDIPGSLFYQRELLAKSCDGRRIDLLTISSVDGMSKQEREPLLPGLFPDTTSATSRPPIFTKEVVFISARVHAGEVPAQHTFKGILSLLMDENDLVAKELRARYVFKLIPVLNPDGVYRGHFRMDQLGQNLNRYYSKPDPILQPAIFAAKSLLDYHAQTSQLAVYLDFHAHASKRGCFIYGNILESIEDQVQNQLYCKLISMNSAHFDYEGCLFSKEHMFRIDPGDQAKGLTAEGSGRVATYLAYGLVHSYTIECNYNTSRIGNEISPMENEYAGPNVTPASPFTTNPEKYTPHSYYGVGRACVIALLDLRMQNPHSRISKSKFKTLERVRNAVVMEVRSRREFFGKQMAKERKRSTQERRVMLSSAGGSSGGEEYPWKRVVDPEDLLITAANAPGATIMPSSAGSGAGGGGGGRAAGASPAGRGGNAQVLSDAAGIIFISARETKGRRSRPPSAHAAYGSSHYHSTQVLPLTEANLHAKDTMVGPWSQAAGSGGGSSDDDNSAPMPSLSQRITSREKLQPYFHAAHKSTATSSGGGDGCTEASRTQAKGRSISLGRAPREDITDRGDLRSDGLASSPIPLSTESEDLRDEPDLSSRSAKSHEPAQQSVSYMHTRDLIREQTINKAIRSHQPYPTANVTPGSTNAALGGLAPLPRESTAFTKRSPSGGSVHKDNRKILGKTLHAAGVALLMGNPPLAVTSTTAVSTGPPPVGNNFETSRPSSSNGRAAGIACLREDGQVEESGGGSITAAQVAAPPLNPYIDLVVTGMGGSRNNSRANNLDISNVHS